MKAKEGKKYKYERRHHWAYEIATKLIEKRPISNKVYRLQSSISPSGVIHIGNFRDTMIVWAIRRVLTSWNINCEFILNFDDADSVKSMLISQDQQEKPLSEVVIGNEKAGKIFSGIFIKELIDVGIFPDRILYQSDMYFNSNRYCKLIDKMLSSTNQVKTILNKYRKKKLNRNWLPLVIYCEECKRQVKSVKVSRSRFIMRTYRRVAYCCEHCGFSFRGKLNKLKYIKLLWRVDWPMRCFAEELDFEPCGIDHYVKGSTITTSTKIIKKVFSSRVPMVFPYEIVKMSGADKKISSSSGDKFSLSIFNKLFPKEIILWKFLSQKLMSPIVINPQQDFFRYHFEFEKLMKNYDNNKETNIENEIINIIGISKNTYCSIINIKMLVFVSQAFDFKIQNILNFLCGYYPENSKEEIKVDLDIKLPRVKYWLDYFAEDKYKFQLTPPSSILPEHKNAAEMILKYIDNPSDNIVVIDNYKWLYEVLFNKQYGPKIKTILNVWNKEKLRQHCLNFIQGG